MTNVRGEKFWLMQPGKHSFLRIPLDTGSKLRVDADVERIGDLCSEMYIKSLNISGSHLHQAGALLLRAGKPVVQVEGQPAPVNITDFAKQSHAFGVLTRSPFMLHLEIGDSHLDVKWKEFHHRGGDKGKYLNFKATHLGETVDVGGLLGHDDHTFAASTPSQCKHAA